MPGIFTVSLDLELYWGVRDKRSIQDYEANLRGERRAIEEMLATFEAHGVHATWATLGFIFFTDVNELRARLPQDTPAYSDSVLSPYPYIEEHEWGEDDQYHFAPEVIELIRSHPGQEIGTHTFSHYYCLEPGQTADAFRADLAAAIDTAHARGIDIQSLVFPRNQGNPEYLSMLQELGIRCYRGNESAPFYTPRNQDQQNPWVRGLRLLDAYVNVTGHNTYSFEECAQSRPYNIPSSRFLRPYSPSFAWMEELRLHRIKRAMRHAAINKRLFHLWWHPHNFGAHIDENQRFLTKILSYYQQLQRRYGMQSLNMGEVSMLLEQLHAG
ncbi:polysaccharide deacetylase family protein [Dyella telluris]|uniref:Polysaccharide deacetylase family protein n=1 Tax=Dyella telluris TaxID=2763498 RepID=A0A7G8Q2P5_9GAMM|nr:polysaccharide deacetylase family protein [Dyella telluris]QNK01053.1 polysaccharide deacetylase family protein [Dyella telluris]